MNKRIILLLLSMSLVLLSFTTVFAAAGDLTVINDSSPVTFGEWTFDDELFSEITFAQEDYLIEINGKNYNLAEINNLMGQGKILEEAAMVIDENESGEDEDIEIPVNISKYEDMISAGYNHTVVIKKDNTVWSWGLNELGELGDGTNISRNTPVKVKDLKAIVSVSASDYYTSSLKSDGTLWSWGGNSWGTLGNGTEKQSSIPVKGKELNSIVSISAGRHHSVVLKQDQTVWSWGWNDDFQLGNESKEYAGKYNYSKVPLQVGGLNNVTHISAGHSHNAALKEDKTLWTWGWNEYGQLGHGTIENNINPTKIDGLNNVMKVSAGALHMVALKEDGTLWTWGENGTSNSSDIPVKVEGINKVVSVSAGSVFTLALKEDGTVWAWGYNREGQLGNGSNSNSNKPTQVKGLNNVVGISAGDAHAVALKEDGTIWSWGSNKEGQLGDGTDLDSNIPVRTLIRLW